SAAMDDAVELLAEGELMQPVRIAQIAIDDTRFALAGRRPVERNDTVAARPQPSGDRSPDQATCPCHQMHPGSPRRLASFFRKSGRCAETRSRMAADALRAQRHGDRPHRRAGSAAKADARAEEGEFVD